MIRIGIFDDNLENIKIIKDEIAKYTIKSNINIEVITVFKNISNKKIKAYVPDINISFVSLDLENGKEISEQIYDANEDCRILFYSVKKNELDHLLKVRPQGFNLLSDIGTDFLDYMDEIICDIKSSKKVFYYESRASILAISQRNILYLQSDLKYVIINLVNGKFQKIYCKLSQIENKLDNDFLRIHKSYIVNTNYLECIDKSNKTVLLTNGEQLPISEAKYKETLNYFSGR